jgi:transcriptional regulator with XRE-family HTH domain
VTDEDLKAKILELEDEIKSKDREIYDSYDRIDQLEETIMKLELCLEEDDEKDSKKKKKSVRETKLEIDLEEKEREIRDLKNRMGVLRKDYNQTQRELAEYTKVNKGTVIRIEEKKDPLEILVKDLNDKIRKQDIIIRELKKQRQEADSENLEKMAGRNEARYKNLKKLMDYKNDIISELIKEMQNHKSLISEPQIQSKIKMIEELNEKISKHIAQN